LGGVYSSKVDLTTSGVDDPKQPESTFSLSDPYPNPTSGTVYIDFSNDSPAFATVEVF